jgi:hypothetical protein
MFCTNCGSPALETNKYCAKCGTEIDTNLATTVSQPPDSVPETSARKQPILLSEWFARLLFGVLLLTSGGNLIGNAILIAHGQPMMQTTGVATFWWAVSFTYFFCKFYWKRSDQSRRGGIINGAVSSFFIIALLYMFAYIFKQ